MRVVPLGSGSRGNATLVEFGASGGLFGPARWLVDAGLSARELERRLRLVDVDPDSIDGMLISHEHDDHARGAERFSRQHGVTVFCTRPTLSALNRSKSHFAEWRPLVRGEIATVDGVEIEAFSVPHDAADPVGFVIAAEGRRFGFATDLGQATASIVDVLRGCDVLMVESNHDDRMLAEGPYPWQLKQRVSGGLGHLSNREAASLLLQTAGSECRTILLAHLSEKNNTHELAEASAASVFRRAGRPVPEIRVAVAAEPTAPVVL